MKLQIDNLDGLGPQDYTGYVDASKNPSLVRKLNSTGQLTFGLTGAAGSFVVPILGGRVTLTLDSGNDLFTGYIAETPTYQYIGWADRGVSYRYEIKALSDVMLMDEKAPPPHPPFVDRNAGNAFEQLTAEALPGWFDVSGVQPGDPIPYYSVNPAKKWTASAAEIATSGRCAYRDDNGKLFFTPLATNIYDLAESTPAFSPSDLQLQGVNRLVNDLTILGPLEPGAHVKDYFCGDGFTTYFYMSQKPFTRSSQVALYNRIILDETYTELDPTHWNVTDPLGVITVNNGQLRVGGGTGIDGQTLLSFIEAVELGGATMLEHGDVVFNGPSNGVIGGLYTGAVSIANCLAGFRVTPSGSYCSIQALIDGQVTGTPLITQAGHHYVFTTTLYPTETYRMQQVFHSSLYPAGSPRGGAAVNCDVRVVLEVQDIDPTNPATQIALATVLFDDIIPSAPGFCTYALINAGVIECSLAFTYIWLPVDALVRGTPSGGVPSTILAGSLLDGAQCQVTTSPALEFYPEYIPPANELLEVSYRAQGHAIARVINSASMQAHQHGGDDGARGSVREIGLPLPRTSADCEIAALALLDDAGQGWSGEYQAWNQFLPGAAIDIFPGDGLAVNVPSRLAIFTAIVREVDVQIINVGTETSRYTLKFVDAGDPSLEFVFVAALMKQTQVLTPIDVTKVGSYYLSDLTDAEVTIVTSTTVTIDVGFTPIAGGGIEVRYSDEGWGMGYSGNLIGRYTSESFALTRYARAQSYFLRSYDGSSPPKYSRYSAALHVDYPL
ncbi:MAG TPA: hypothetical protein VK828_04455 [Terriglobales bacterium]|jgi:hypothetical protein|nr:hypothetical protein [Terriglobales bacterium]